MTVYVIHNILIPYYGIRVRLRNRTQGQAAAVSVQIRRTRTSSPRVRRLGFSQHSPGRALTRSAHQAARLSAAGAIMWYLAVNYDKDHKLWPKVRLALYRARRGQTLILNPRTRS